MNSTNLHVSFRGVFRVIAISIALVTGAGSSSAQIVVGQTANLAEDQTSSARDASLGARLYFDKVNASGGVFGSTIEFIAMDDAGDSKMAQKNASDLIEKKGAIALLLPSGMQSSLDVISVASASKVPVIGPISGAMILRKDVGQYAFNIRAGHQAEVGRGLDYLAILGQSSPVIVYTNDPFGKDALSAANLEFEKRSLKPLALIAVNPQKVDAAVITGELLKSGAKSVILLSESTKVSAEIVKAIRQAGSFMTVVALSTCANERFASEVGKAGVGVVVGQVFPAENVPAVGDVCRWNHNGAALSRINMPLCAIPHARFYCFFPEGRRHVA